MKNIYEVSAANKRKSIFIILLFIVFVTLSVYFISQAFGLYLGYEPGGFGIAGLALIISGLMSLGSYWFSDKIVLSISKAKPASREEYFDFYTVAENLSLASGMPKPKLYVIDDTALNAFATGRDPEHGVVVATTGLLDTLNRTELEGVIGHELTHIRNYDTRLMAIVAVLVGLVALLGDWFLRTSFRVRGGNSKESKSSGAIIILIGLLFAILSPIIVVVL